MATRSEEAARAFLRHRLLQLRSRELAQQAIRSASFSIDERIDFQFADAPAEVERVAREARGLRLERSAPPVGSSGTPPPLQIAILVVGTRGDVQPFVPIGQRLVRDGHRVRLATHAVFRDFVESNGLEFYPLGGDPKALIAYMVKTGGALLPSHLDEIVDDVPKKRKMLEEIIESCWGACTAADPGRAGAPAFTADAIIANPPSYAHAHVAEKLRVPLQMMFTMPWTPTTAFPQPLASLDPGRHQSRLNWISYAAVDLLTWAGIGDIINRFRTKTLGLPALHVTAEGADVINDRAVPFTYLWSPALIPKPDDWHDTVDVADFVFLEQQSHFTPPPDLAAFLDAGPPPIYVGFGSCVVENPAELTRTIFAALEAAGMRGIVSAGWGGLGGVETPPSIHIVGECPHDWLFPRCAAVCHHGGAGTTATGLRCDRPTVIIPFFGDQPFWGHMVAAAGAGPAPVPIRELRVERLAAAFRASAQPEVRARAAEVGAVLRSRNGADLAVEAFYRHLPRSTDGVLAHLGFGAVERARVEKGEVVAVEPAAQRGSVLLSSAVRIGGSLDRFCELVASGRTLEVAPGAIAWKHLGVDTTAADFAGVGLGPDQDAEVDALLHVEPGDAHNFSSQEIERFNRVRLRLGSHPDPESAREAVSRVLRNVLFERMRAYREGGLDAIAPYSRGGGRVTSPADVLRASSPADSLFATEFRPLYDAFMGFPRIAHPEAQHRLSWIARESPEGLVFLLDHGMLARYGGIAVLALRHFYATRLYDALSLTCAVLQEDAEIQATATWRVVAGHVSGLHGLLHHAGARHYTREAVVEHVRAIRVVVEADEARAVPPRA